MPPIYGLSSSSSNRSVEKQWSKTRMLPEISTSPSGGRR
uniref:Uncharacterized protein n=1 Tax=Arundo donax TaxID=35708 RepID=A0A0A9A9Z3_ARUDO